MEIGPRKRCSMYVDAVNVKLPAMGQITKGAAQYVTPVAIRTSLEAGFAKNAPQERTALKGLPNNILATREITAHGQVLQKLYIANQGRTVIRKTQPCVRTARQAFTNLNMKGHIVNLVERDSTAQGEALKMV